MTTSEIKGKRNAILSRTQCVKEYQYFVNRTNTLSHYTVKNCKFFIFLYFAAYWQKMWKISDSRMEHFVDTNKSDGEDDFLKRNKMAFFFFTSTYLSIYSFLQPASIL